MSQENSLQSWRPVLAALANPDARAVYAQIVLGLTPEAAGLKIKDDRYAKIVQQLTRASLITVTEGHLAVNSETLPAILKEAGDATKAVGPERFLNRAGEIDRYPTNLDERTGLLVFVARQAIGTGEQLTEPEINARLERFDSDVARLRRHLIDYGVLVRTANGSEYSLHPDHLVT